ncbi:MAG: tetratricopeptide repeat protein [Chloroflexi bacterium]|nr:MAG: tetratricopeptide repeat protein [Chloroflexota bacterium]
MSTADENKVEAENFAFFQEVFKKALLYRLSFVQREKENYEALSHELPNFWEVVGQSYLQKHWTAVSAFRDALQGFLDLQGYWTQSLALNQWACEAARESGEVVNEIRWTHDRANILLQRGQNHEAETLYTFCEEKARSLGNIALALKSRNQRALCLRSQGRIAEAEQLCQTTLDEARRLGLDRWIPPVLYTLSLFIRDQGDLKKAEQCVEEGLRLVDPTDIALIAHFHHSLGEIALLLGQRDKARIHMEKSIQLSEQARVVRRIAATKRLLGDLERIEGHYQAAEKLYDEALAIVSRIEDLPVLARLLLSKAKLKLQMKHRHEGIALLRAAVAHYQKTGDARTVGGVSLLLMVQYLRQGYIGQVILVGFNGLKVVLASDMLRPRVLFNFRRLRTWWYLLAS